MTIRLGDVPESSGAGERKPLPEGRYDLKVGDVSLGKSPTKGTPQLSVFAEIVGASREAGKKRFINFYLTKKALWRLSSFLQACAYDKARQDVDEDELVNDLNKLQPVFSAWTEPDGDYDNFSDFRAVATKAATATASASSEPDDKDIPF